MTGPTGYLCPNCDGALTRHDVERGAIWVCSKCGGRAVGISLLRRGVARDYVNELWRNAIERGSESHRRCPSCSQVMIEAPVRTVDLDVCKRDQLVWFDPGEFASAPAVPGGTSRSHRLPEPALEAAARVQARAIAADYQRRYGEEMPLDEALLMVPGVMGLPLEEETAEEQTIPWATWALLVVIGFVTTIAFFDADVADRFGLLPRDAFRLGGLTFVTSFFIHGGVLQAITNLYFLAVFGDNVEDYLGRATYVLLIALGALAGEGVHALFTDERTVPLVGATGGVTAVVVFYGLKFPNARLRYFRVFRWYTMPASAAVLLWLIASLFGSRARFLSFGETSPLVYAGGAAIGSILWVALRNQAATSG